MSIFAYKNHSKVTSSKQIWKSTLWTKLLRLTKEHGKFSSWIISFIKDKFDFVTEKKLFCLRRRLRHYVSYTGHPWRYKWWSSGRANEAFHTVQHYSSRLKCQGARTKCENPMIIMMFGNRGLISLTFLMSSTPWSPPCAKAV